MNLFFSTDRNSRPKVFCKKGVVKNFAKFTGKHRCWGLFFKRVAALLKKRLKYRRFPVNFTIFLKHHLALFWCLYCLLWTYFTLCSSVSIDNFKHVIAGWYIKKVEDWLVIKVGISYDGLLKYVCFVFVNHSIFPPFLQKMSLKQSF